MEDEARDEAEKKERSLYWVICPACGRRVVKKELMNKGCYLCGWQGTEEDLEQAGTQSVHHQQGQVSSHGTKGNTGSYRIDCPHCGRQVIREEFENSGCFICGYKASGRI